MGTHRYDGIQQVVAPKALDAYADLHPRHVVGRLLQLGQGNCSSLAVHLWHCLERSAAARRPPPTPAGAGQLFRLAACCLRADSHCKLVGRFHGMGQVHIVQTWQNRYLPGTRQVPKVHKSSYPTCTLVASGGQPRSRAEGVVVRPSGSLGSEGSVQWLCRRGRKNVLQRWVKQSGSVGRWDLRAASSGSVKAIKGNGRGDCKVGSCSWW